jgi:NTP pyrophosphatase (non-canonical NTP hydrolase)
MDTPVNLYIYDQIDRERQRAHAKHGASSIEGRPPADSGRLAILVEEVGEVARNLNDRRHADTTVELLDFDALLRAELVQVAAMAVGWIAAIDRTGRLIGGADGN